jgi:hypothetical protein
LNEITQTDGTSAPTGSITRMWMFTSDIYVEDDEKMFYQREVDSGQGIHYLIETYETQCNNLLASGSSSFNIQLTNLKGACKELFMVIRNPSDWVTTAPNPNNSLFTFYQIASWSGVAGDIIFMDQKDDAYNRFYENVKNHKGAPGNLIYTHSFAKHSENFKHATGHKTWATMTNPTITVNFSSNLGSNMYADFLSLNLNNLQDVRGELSITFV